MKNYYAILEVPVGCSLEEIRQAYRRLAQGSLDDEAAFGDLKEAYEVLTTPARRAEYDQAAWGETFAPGSQPSEAAGDSAPTRPGRCPMGAEAQCPVLQGHTGAGDKFCPECGYLLASLSAAANFDAGPPDDPSQSVRLEGVDGRTHRLRAGLNVVGREAADVLLPDKTVSRQHARLELSDEGAVTVEDLSSTNGTQVNGQDLAPHVPRLLSGGDRLRFGSVALELHLPAPEPVAGEPAPTTPAASPSGEDSPAGAARARIVEMREDDPREFPLIPGVTTFGRRAENSVVLLGDPYVSGNHAQIIADGDTFRLTDVGSTNGTLRNGERLPVNEPALLSSGDVILIGGTAFRFEVTSDPASDTAPDAGGEPPERTAPEYDVEQHEAREEDAPSPDAPQTDDAPIHAQG